MSEHNCEKALAPAFDLTGEHVSDLLVSGMMGRRGFALNASGATAFLGPDWMAVRDFLRHIDQSFRAETYRTYDGFVLEVQSDGGSKLVEVCNNAYFAGRVVAEESIGPSTVIGRLGEVASAIAVRQQISSDVKRFYDAVVKPARERWPDVVPEFWDGRKPEPPKWVQRAEKLRQGALVRDWFTEDPLALSTQGATP